MNIFLLHQIQMFISIHHKEMLAKKNLFEMKQVTKSTAYVCTFSSALIHGRMRESCVYLQWVMDDEMALGLWVMVNTYLTNHYNTMFISCPTLEG